MSGKQKLGKGLFSQHFLSNSLHSFPEWQEDVSTAFTELKALFDILPTLAVACSGAAAQEQGVGIPKHCYLGFCFCPPPPSSMPGEGFRNCPLEQSLSGLTFAPQTDTASPAARILLAALISRS